MKKTLLDSESTSTIADAPVQALPLIGAPASTTGPTCWANADSTPSTWLRRSPAWWSSPGPFSPSPASESRYRPPSRARGSRNTSCRRFLSPRDRSTPDQIPGLPQPISPSSMNRSDSGSLCSPSHRSPVSGPESGRVPVSPLPDDLSQFVPYGLVIGSLSPLGGVSERSELVGSSMSIGVGGWFSRCGVRRSVWRL